MLAGALARARAVREHDQARMSLHLRERWRRELLSAPPCTSHMHDFSPRAGSNFPFRESYLDEISDQYHAHDTKIVIRSQDLPFFDRNDPCLSDIHCFMGRAFRSVMDEAHVSTGRVAERTNLRDPFFLPRMLEDTLDNTCASDVHRFPPSTACFCSLLFTKTPQCSLGSHSPPAALASGSASCCHSGNRCR